MPDTVIDRMYYEFVDLLSFLDKSGEVSLRVAVDNTFKKTLALSAASYFEDEIRRVLIDMVTTRTGSDELISSFIKNKAISRQYHTLFQWKENNANSFFGLFGDNFKEKAKIIIKENQELSTAVRSFLELGNLRNELAHLNFASFILDKTAEEVYSQYRSALFFIEFLENQLKK